MIQDIVSMRPGTIFGYQGDSYKVLHNDTLNRRFQAKRIEPGKHGTIKTFNYIPGQTMNIRWKPTNHQ